MVRTSALARACAVVLSASSAARGDSDAATTGATLTCERVVGPGRVRCEVEARVEPGVSITWGDVVLLRVPPFAAALRGRIGPSDTSARAEDRWRWAFAVVARASGSGDVDARVRLVVCRDGARDAERNAERNKVCSPRQIAVTGRLVVGE